MGASWSSPDARQGPRTPVPLLANGRLLAKVIDAYNGTILWSFQAPAFRRANMPRDCSNMLVSGDRLYIASGSYCYVIDAHNRRKGANLYRPRPLNWGYLVLSNGLLIGSGTFDGAQYFGDQGE